MSSLSSAMERSGRMGTTEMSASVSCDNEQSDSRARHRNSAVTDSLLTTLPNLDFMPLLQTCLKHGIPSLVLRKPTRLETSSEMKYVDMTITLGSGLTSIVEQYTTTEDDQVNVPPGTVVALKTFRSTTDSRLARQAVFECIVGEIEVLSHPLVAGHPNIVQLCFLGWRNDEAFPGLAMEHAAHGSLDFLIRGAWAGLDPPQFQQIREHLTIDILMGLHAIHEAGFVHGDLKPENVLVMSHPDESRQVIAKVIDFGGSSRLAGHDGGRPRHYTPLWCAPEVLNEDPDIDWEKADVYSYGLIVGSLWADVPGRGGFGTGRLNERSSCFLGSCISPSMSKEEKKTMLWSIKSQSDETQSNNIIYHLNQRLKVSVPDEDYRSQLVDILGPALRAHFWLRPSAEELLLSVQTMPRHMGRGSWQVAMTPPESHAEYLVKSQSLRFFHRNRSPTYPPALVEQAALALWDAACPGWNLSFESDLPETLSDDMLPEEYFWDVARVYCRLQYGSESFAKDLGQQTDFENARTRGSSVWFLAMSSLSDLESPSRRDKFDDLIWACAAAGCNPAIEYAVLALHGTHKGMQLPMRGLLSLLALSQSYRASEMLHARWPAHYKMVQTIIAERPSASEEAKDCDHFDLPFMFWTLITFEKQPILNTELTLKQAMNLGLVKVIRDALNGNVVPDDFYESVAGLLHGLSRLPDSEAAALASMAYKRGAKLCFLAEAEMSTREDIGTTETGSYAVRKLSPLSAAIRRGKPKLALAILDLHVEHHGEPIVDFGQAFYFSCVCLLHDIADQLLRLYRSSPHLCHEGGSQSLFSETILSESLFELLSPVVELELEMRKLHGPRYDIAKEQTQRVLVENGASLVENFGNPPITALKKVMEIDNVTVLKYFLQALENRGIDVLDHLKALREVHRDSDSDPDGYRLRIDALSCCIIDNSIQSFQYLLQKYPLQSWETAESHLITTKLHEACIMWHGTPFIETLLGYGADCTARDIDERTPLALALQMGPLESTYAFLSHRPAETLRELQSRDPETGWSVFHQLLQAWCTIREPEMLDKFKWIIKHDGIHRLGPSDIPFWMWILNSAAGHQTDTEQRLDVALFTLLLDTDKLSSVPELSNEKILGGNILHFAIIFGHVRMVRLLLDKGIDYNVTMECEMTGYFLMLDGLDGEVDPKHAISSLDLAWSGCSRVSMPPEIPERGYFEAQKWFENKQEVRNLLLEKGAHQGNFLGLHKDAIGGIKQRAIVHDNWYNDAMNQPNQTGIVHGNRSGGSWGTTTDFVSSWPKPLVDTPTVPIQSSEHVREILSSERGRLEWIHDTFGSVFMKETMNEERETEQGDISRDLYLHIMKTKGHIQRHQWRLPPDWYCLFITNDKAEHGGYRSALYVNRETGKYTFEKPQLYRAGKVARGDVTKGDERSIDEEPEDIYNATPMMKPQLTPETPTLLDLTPLSLEESRVSPDSEQTSTQNRAGQLPSSSWTQDSSSRQTTISRTDGPSPNVTDMAEDFYIIDFPDDYPNTTFKDGSNVIHLAVLLGNLSVLSIVLEKDATAINTERHDGSTALHVAVDTKNVDALAMLMAYGADPNRCFPNREYRPIHHSALQDSADMAKVLVQEDTNVTNRMLDYCPPYLYLSGDVPRLYVPGEENQSSCSDRSTTLGIVTTDVNATTAEGRTPLHLCVAAGGRADILETLIGAGADVNAMAPEGSVLREAVASGCETGVEMLLDAGARINADEHLLHAAAACGSVRITRKLLDLGLDVNQRDGSKQTPLVAAIGNRHQDIIDLLCERGASKNTLKEFKFFTRPRNDGKTEAKVLHVGHGSGTSTGADGEVFRSDDACGRWEEWDPVQIVVSEGKEVSADHD